MKFTKEAIAAAARAANEAAYSKPEEHMTTDELRDRVEELTSSMMSELQLIENDDQFRERRGLLRHMLSEIDRLMRELGHAKPEINAVMTRFRNGIVRVLDYCPEGRYRRTDPLWIQTFGEYEVCWHYEIMPNGEASEWIYNHGHKFGYTREQIAEVAKEARRYRADITRRRDESDRKRREEEYAALRRREEDYHSKMRSFKREPEISPISQ